MLPFLAKAKMKNVTAMQATPAGEVKPADDSDDYKACAQRLIDAVHAKDVDAVAAVLADICKEESDEQQA